MHRLRKFLNCLLRSLSKASWVWIGCVAAANSASARAADWPQYRGPNHDGSSPEKILKNWPKEGPRRLWKAPLGDSFGSFAISGGRAFCFIQHPVDGQDREVAIALDTDTGKELWATALGKATYDSEGGDGPRSTPTVDDNRAYFLGAYQVLSCLDAATGKVIWQRDLVKDYKGIVIGWKNAASPILEGDLIFVNAGGPGQALLAFHKQDGSLAWKGESDKPTHSSPVPATLHGVRQIIFFTKSGLVAVVPTTGQALWRFPFPYATSTAMSPVVFGDIVYCSAGYVNTSAACKITKTGDQFTATQLWRVIDNRLINQWTTPVCKDGYLYGVFGFKDFGDGPLKCINIATGKVMWSQPGFGSGGATILVDGHVLVQADRGPLVLVEATPAGYKEVARTQPLGGQCWTMPVISNGRLYVRNTKEGVCLDVAPPTDQR
jgi:outer membrane protein assembly factor BamB